MSIFTARVGGLVSVVAAGRAVSAATPSSGGSVMYGGHTGTLLEVMEPGGNVWLRVSVRSLGNELMPTSETPLTSTIRAAVRCV